MSSFENNKVPIEKLFNSLSSWITKEECFNYLKESSKNMIKNGKKIQEVIIGRTLYQEKFYKFMRD